MKKKQAVLFVIFSSVLYFLSFLLPYLTGSGFSFYLFDYFGRFSMLLCPIGTVALLIPSSLREKEKHLFGKSTLLTAPRLFYAFFSYYLAIYDYGFSTGLTILFSLILSALSILLIGFIIYLLLYLLALLLPRYEKKHPLGEGYAAFDFSQKTPFCIGVLNMGYVLATLLYEVVNAVIFLCRHFHSYSPFEIVYMGVTFILLFAFFFPIQWIALWLAKTSAKDGQVTNS